MKFLYPEFLYALFALAIPLIIHLFNFRRYKRISFTNVAFLRTVNERTQASQKLKHLLVLLSRLLLLAFLILAFAQPVIPRKDAEAVRAEKAVSIFVDNSFSMQAENEEGQLLLQALAKARSVAESYSPTTEFQLLTHSFEGRHQRFTTQEDLLEQIDEIEIVPQSQTLSEIIARQSDLLHTAEGKDQHLYIISDFQKHHCDFENLSSDTTIQINLLPIDAQTADNVYIDSLWFDQPFHNLNQQERMSIRIRNHGEKTAEDMPMSIWIDGAQTSIGTFSTESFSRTDTALYFDNDRPGIRHGYVDIDDYPITFDDRFYFSYSVDSTLKVLEINGAGWSEDKTYFSRIFADDPMYDFDQVNARNIDFSQLKNSHFIVLNELDALSSGLMEELKEFVDNGGSVLVIPGTSIDGTSLNEFTRHFNGPAFSEVVEGETKVATIDSDAPFFADLFEQIPRNMDLPSVLSYYRLRSASAGNDRTLMSLRTGDPFLSYTPFGNGSLYVSAVPLSTENNNFARHAIFVATVLRMSELSRTTGALSYDLSEEIAIPTGNRVPSGNEVFKIARKDGNFEIIPEFSNIGGKGFIFVRDHLQDAGNYVLSLGEEDIMGLAFNYPRKESVMEHFNSAELRERINERGISNVVLLDQTGDALASALLQLESGRKLWKIFLLIALLFVLAETLLLKFWKS